ncbi:MAG TPA: sialate O-acetylesterase [Acidisarcina sp.]|nr:sialate O-acetylesterase [Acidisarcina sp.]
MAALFALLSASAAWSEVKLPSIYADHMVVQRGMPVVVRGSANPGEAVSVTFRGATRKAVADKFGLWEVGLPAGIAGGPFTMDVVASNTVTFSDVLVGDVWVASGQSNMEFPMSRVRNAAEELKTADRPNIRLFHVEKAASQYALDDVTAKTWVACTPETVTDFSAVAFFFAKDVQADQKVPLGLIEADWGGTPAEAWTSMRALSADASLMPVFSEWGKMTDAQSHRMRELDYEKHAREAAKAEGKPEPRFPWHPEIRSYAPGELWNAMIAPLTHFPIRGVIWYQGETNSAVGRWPIYSHLFQTMIRDWRHSWGQGDFPFLFVQISSYHSPEENWPEARDAQRRVLALRNTAMAVTIDIGNPDDVHPTNKQDVGARLALAARALAYNETLEYSGPLYRMVSPEEGGLRVWFDHSAGLVAKGGAPRGFEIAGADRKFVKAQARIDGQSVVVSSAEVAEPEYVRYSWSEVPDGNLYNAAGLPASPFVSD